MKWYVATSVKNMEAARAAMALLRAAGHEITHDWTQTDLNLDPAVRTSAAMECAVADRHGVERAECFLLLNFPGIRAAYTEMGMAYANCQHILVVDAFKEGCPENVFFYDWKHVSCVPSVEAAIEHVRKNAGRFE